MKVTFVLTILAGYELDPSDMGIVNEDGADDQQAFLASFFKAPQRLQSRSGRTPRSVSKPAPTHRTNVTQADEPGDYTWTLQREFSIITSPYVRQGLLCSRSVQGSFIFRMGAQCT